MKTVLITGASRGIGAATAKKFAQNGYNVIINYVSNDEAALKLKKELEAFNVKILVEKADISKEENVKKMVDETIKTFGNIDVLVNNAGISLDCDINTKNVNDFKKVLDVNLVGPFLVSKYVGMHMMERKCGKIINVSSTNGIDTNYPESIDYDASKAGLISMTKNFARYYAPYINVNAIACGWVNTDATKEISDTFEDLEKEKILLKRFAEPDEIASVIYFLSTDDARYINSSVIRVDGGY